MADQDGENDALPGIPLPAPDPPADAEQDRDQEVRIAALEKPLQITCRLIPAVAGLPCLQDRVRQLDGRRQKLGRRRQDDLRTDRNGKGGLFAANFRISGMNRISGTGYPVAV